MDYLRLSECADYRSERTNQIDYETYITTENMLPNRSGVIQTEALPDSKTVSKYLPNDILLSNIRPYFKKIWFSNREGGCSNDVLVVKAKSNVIPRFLYYVLSDNNFFNYDNVTSKGTKMPRGTPNAIMKYLVPDISTQQQKRIVSILSAYDNLIEVNNKKIKVLEQMAENLYKEWFVRFRFPGHETAEFENGIPKGWTIKRLGDYGRVETGKTPSMEISEYYGDDYLFIKTPEMHGNVFVIDTEEKLSKRGHLSQPKKLLPTNSIMVTCIGTGGVVAINAEPGHTNQQINSIILDDLIYLEWLFFTCRSMRTTIEMFGATGSTMTNLSKGKFEKLKILEPNFELIEQFHRIADPMLREIEKLMRANQKLACQRDLLLPRLMSGKLEV